jgi:hypothetical protein
VKRCNAILLLALLLYNAFGYYVLFAYQNEQIHLSALKELPDTDYNILKFNLAIYTSVADTDFEYFNEEFTIGNKTYNVVKKRIKNDTLHLYCLRNFQKEELRKNLNNIALNQAQNHDSSDNIPFKNLIKTFIKDYLPYQNELLLIEKIAFPTEGGGLNSKTPPFKIFDFYNIQSPPPKLA